ncbi:hypothetical protein V8E51_000180 [Hyaloscypha variabilis]
MFQLIFIFFSVLCASNVSAMPALLTLDSTIIGTSVTGSNATSISGTLASTPITSPNRSPIATASSLLSTQPKPKRPNTSDANTVQSTNIVQAKHNATNTKSRNSIQSTNFVQAKHSATKKQSINIVQSTNIVQTNHNATNTHSTKIVQSTNIIQTKHTATKTQSINIVQSTNIVQTKHSATKTISGGEAVKTLTIRPDSSEDLVIHITNPSHEEAYIEVHVATLHKSSPVIQSTHTNAHPGGPAKSTTSTLPAPTQTSLLGTPAGGPRKGDEASSTTLATVPKINMTPSGPSSS